MFTLNIHLEVDLGLNSIRGWNLIGRSHLYINQCGCLYLSGKKGNHVITDLVVIAFIVIFVYKNIINFTYRKEMKHLLYKFFAL